MRWKLLRRRLSISAPRMIVSSRLPWPLRWAALALMFGFSAAIALWAFEFGKEIAGLDRGDKEELLRVRQELVLLRQEHEAALSVANTADSLVKAERATHEKLAQQLRQAESEKQALQADLGFFERLLPAADDGGVQLRGLQIETAEPGRLRYQVLVMQSAKGAADFKGSAELVASGQLDGKAASWPLLLGPLTLKQYARLEGTAEVPPGAVIKTVQARVLDARGVVQATRTVKP
jgi:hypothetical protein